MTKPLPNNGVIPAQTRHGISKGKKISLLFIVAFFQLCMAEAQFEYYLTTAAGETSWYSWSSNSVDEVELYRGGEDSHYDGYDGALRVTVSGTNVTSTSSYHFSTTYGAVIHNIAVTNNGATASTFSLRSYGNLGSDGSTTWHYKSSTNNYYTVSSDNGISQDGYDPVISFIYGGASLNAFSPLLIASNGNDNHDFRISGVPIAAGQTRRFLIIGGVGDIDDNQYNRPDMANVAVQALLDPANWPADFTSFLTPTEKSQIMNWGAFNTLPVTWQSFTATPQLNKVQLNWSTSSEENTKNFNVEHSIDGQRWDNLAVITAAGNANSSRSYSYTHLSPSAGKNYYRILQKDIDGRSSYSATKVVAIEKRDKTMEILGNPVKGGTLRVWVSNSTLVKLADATGKIYWQKTLTAGNNQVDVSGLSAGVYFLQSSTDNHQVLISK